MKWIFQIILVSIIATPAVSSAERLTVVTTLFPLYEFAREVGGEAVDVSLLLPAGAEPHTWEPKPSDIAKINDSDDFIYLGEEMEPWIASLIKAIPKEELLVLEVIEDLASPRNTPGSLSHDPHVWLDFAAASLIVTYMADSLSDAFPDRETYFQDNAEMYNEKLNELDDLYFRSLRKCRPRTFVFGGHAAFGQLAARYDLNQISIYSTSPDSEPSPKLVTAIVRTIRDKRLKVVYFEDLVNPRLSRVVAREAGVSTLSLNPGGNLTEAQWEKGTTFISLMEENLVNLMKGWRCG
jgi:zinc transport system substrate-binding protein